MNPSTRTLRVPASRLTGWMERFAAAHQGVADTTDTDDGVLLEMCDGATALLSPPWPDEGRPGRGISLVGRLISLASQERRLGIVLVRRGGYAVGVSVGGKLLAHKVGTASARSRGGDQGAAMVERVAAQAAGAFSGENFEYLATGGDKQLVESALAVPALRRYAGLARLEPLPVTDPRMDVLIRATADFCSVRIRVTDGR
ncbi:hypothetical protein AOC05_07600 [Arthrobacter alpinus]|uniref:Actinobacteria/chloroflexi VLRF1 release factor domain-containing protein n=1 Tax=Arthrobacter alpinus TaxID=656366 RepID=A0A0M4RB90_9MICC|nr:MULTISPECIES: acVLRF1 family peptidyl-tRNA hydrolase [Arthrobacter]ALE92231.1 hypothetical protein AOC05_07600 [Arthrobacter alpinus]